MTGPGVERAQHSPGPWHATADKVTGSRPQWSYTFNAEVPEFIASVGGKTAEAARANARLIAAAPALLAALEALTHAVHCGVDADPEIWRSAHRLADAAIAQARGEVRS